LPCEPRSDQNDVIYMGNYQHWGVVMPGSLLEPNNQIPDEYCAGSNLTMGISTYDKKGVVYDGVGGWADRRCFEQYVFICEVQRECCCHLAPVWLVWTHLQGCCIAASSMAMRVPHACNLLALSAAPDVFPEVMSTYTNQTFQLHTTPMNQSEAQATCNAAGGHLASFSMLEEQAEVEQAYLDMVGYGTGHAAGNAWYGDVPVGSISQSPAK
jgi:hypothetical protein